MLSNVCTVAVIYIPLSGLPPAIFGNDFGFFTALYAYTAVHMSEEERGIRYLLIPFAMTVAGTIGNYASGLLIAMKPIINESQLQNYTGCFLASITSSFIVMTAACWFLDYDTEPQSEPLEPIVDNKAASTSFKLCSGSPGETTESVVSVTRIMTVDSDASLDLFSKALDILDYKQLVDIWHTCFKKREGTLRLRIWMMIICINLVLIPSFGRAVVIFPLVQKLYKWDSVIYSNLNSISGFVHLFGMIAIIPLLFKVFKANDCQTSMVGYLFGITGDIFIGSITSAMGFYAHLTITTFSSTGATGCRTYISKFMPKDEIAKIFAVVLVLESFAKAMASFFFAFLLKVTIHSYPTFVFHFMAIILIIGLILLVYTDLITPINESTKPTMNHQNISRSSNQNQFETMNITKRALGKNN